MNAKNDFLFLIFVILLLWGLWYFTSGSGDEGKSGGFFPDTSLWGMGTTTGDAERPSLFKDELLITDTSGAQETDANKEHLGITASPGNKSPLYISEWTVKNSGGKSVRVGKAASLPYSSRINTETPLFLPPGDRAIITSGRSPIGVSFQVNSCSGYLEQFQTFSPPLSGICPDNAADARLTNKGLDEQCIAYIGSLPPCSVYTGPIPANISPQCADHIRNGMNYNACVDLHKTDHDFYRHEWRIFLGENEELWSGVNGLVRLYDQSGNLVDSQSY